MKKTEIMKDKLQGVWGLFARYRLLRWGLLFVLICFGLLILSASKVSFFGITIERETAIEEVLDDVPYGPYLDGEEPEGYNDTEEVGRH